MSPLVVVLNMFFIRSKQPQIAGLIIGLVAIAMMDDFSGFKVAANQRFNHKAMLAHIPVAVGIGMLGYKNESISMLHDEWSSPECSAAVARAEFSFSANRIRLAAVKTRGSRATPAGKAAKMSDPIQLTIGTVEWNSTTATADVRSHRFGRESKPCCVSALGSSLIANSPFAGGATVASATAIDVFQQETAWRVINVGTAFTAYPIHWYWILPRWTKKDMGHFELRPA